MEKKRSVGITIIGWFFILSAIFYLIWFPRAIASFNALFKIAKDIPEYNISLGLPISSIIGIAIGFLLIMITGIGILKLKPWAYYLALVIIMLSFSNIIWSIWFFGTQFYKPLQLSALLFISISVFLFLARKRCRETFQVESGRFKRLKSSSKTIIIIVSVIIFIRLLTIPLWFVYVNIKYKDQLPLINLKPEKVEYVIKDREFILKGCKKINIFENSIYIPKNWKISFMLKGDDAFGWTMSFINMEDSDMIGFILLDSKGFQEVFLPMSKVLKFESLYDFEKKFNYPTGSPLYSIMKIVGLPSGLKSIEEAKTAGWQGFIKIHEREKKGVMMTVFDCSLYSSKDGRTSSFALMFKEGAMTMNQAKSIVASFEFKSDFLSNDYLFDNGKKALSSGDFEKAALCFLNALYKDGKNPEYAYYLGLSLFGDKSELGRKARLNSAEYFVKYSLELSADYKKAKELLKMVKSEIETRENDEKH